MVSINLLKNVTSFGFKNLLGHTPPVKIPFKPVAEKFEYPMLLAQDVVEFSPVARCAKQEISAAKTTIAKENNFFETAVAKERNILKQYENKTIDDILKPTKDTRFFQEDEADAIQCAVDTLGDETPEFKAMLESLVEQKKYQTSIMSCDETNVSDTIWTLMSVQDEAGASMKNVSNLVNGFAKNKNDLQDINTFLDNLVNTKNRYILEEIDKLEPILTKLSKNIKITDNDFLSCAHCILKNDPQFSEFLLNNTNFLKAYNSIGLKLPNEDIRLMMKNFTQKISPDETDALMLYKAESKKISVGELSQQADTIKNYLDKQSLTEKVNVYRGEDYGFVDSVQIGDETLGDILRANEKSSKEQLKELIATKLSDYQIIQDRFMSTSFDPNIVESGKFGSKIVWNLTLPKNTKAACIDMLLPQNALAGETEVLVQKNSQLFIKNLQFENNKWYIDSIVIQ